MAGIDLVDAAAAYGRAMTQQAGGATAAAGDAGKGFQDALSGLIENTATATEGAEKASAGAVIGNTDVIDVVTAMSNAELMVETVVAVRDKVIQAYNDVIRMPM